MIYVHESALIEEGVTIGDGSRIWHDVHVRKGASIGERCILGKGVYVDADVPIGDDCKLQNYACIYRGARLGRGVFAGPHVVFANDMRPVSYTHLAPTAPCESCLERSTSIAAAISSSPRFGTISSIISALPEMAGAFVRRAATP